jgi:hypothetical protein
VNPHLLRGKRGRQQGPVDLVQANQARRIQLCLARVAVKEEHGAPVACHESAGEENRLSALLLNEWSLYAPL